MYTSFLSFKRKRHWILGLTLLWYSNSNQMQKLCNVMGAIFLSCTLQTKISLKSANKIASQDWLKQRVFTCQKLWVIRVCKVEALQSARDTSEVLAAPGASSLQHPLGAGDLGDQHAPVPGLSHQEANYQISLLPAGCWGWRCCISLKDKSSVITWIITKICSKS